MQWPEDPTDVQADASERARELAGQTRRAALALVGLGALFLVVIGAVVYVVFRSSAPDTRVVRVEVASLTAQAEAVLRYPGATVLSHADTAGVSTLTAQYTVSGGGSRADPFMSTLQGYSGPVNPARATQLLSVRAAAAKVDAWYRGALLHRGWCVAQHDTTPLPGTTISATQVLYLRGRASYEVDFGNSHLVRYLSQRDQPGGATDADAATLLLGAEAQSGFDVTKADQFVHSLEDSTKAPLTVYTSYDLYPDGSISTDASCSP
jgi:hypothetical protein